MDTKKTFRNIGLIIFQTLFVISAVITILLFIVRDKTELKIEIVSHLNVFDINQEVSNLDILYDSVSLKDNDLMLSLIFIRFRNTGFNNILKEYFDLEYPVGINVVDGQIIEKPEIRDASNDYLLDALTSIQFNDSSIAIPPVHMDRNDFINLSLLILHNSDNSPEVVAIGKLAGQKGINVAYAIEVDNDESISDRLFKGNIWIQLLRFIFYTIIVLIIIVIIAGIANREPKQKRSDRKYINRSIDLFIEKHPEGDDIDYDLIYDHYRTYYNDFDIFRAMIRTINDEDKIVSVLKEDDDIPSTRLTIIEHLRRCHIIERTEDGFKIDSEMRDRLIKFVRFIERHGFTVEKEGIRETPIRVFRSTR